MKRQFFSMSLLLASNNLIVIRVIRRYFILLHKNLLLSRLASATSESLSYPQVCYFSTAMQIALVYSACGLTKLCFLGWSYRTVSLFAAFHFFSGKRFLFFTGLKL